MLDRVLDALGTLRSPFAPYEADLHLRVGECLRATGLPAVHEALLAPGCRIDYLVGGVGVEIKKGRPDPAALRRQLDRYAACQGVEALVVLTERAVPLPGPPARQARARGGAEPPVGGGAAVNEDVSLIPPYLLDTDGAQPEEGGAHRTYGTLSYNRRRDCWVVRGDPGVTELCKRLFPGSESGRRGEARFPAHRRIVGDLNWLMLRYPLAVRRRGPASAGSRP